MHWTRHHVLLRTGNCQTWERSRRELQPPRANHAQRSHSGVSTAVKRIYLLEPSFYLISRRQAWSAYGSQLSYQLHLQPNLQQVIAGRRASQCPRPSRPARHHRWRSQIPVQIQLLLGSAPTLMHPYALLADSCRAPTLGCCNQTQPPTSASSRTQATLSSSTTARGRLIGIR